MFLLISDFGNSHHHQGSQKSLNYGGSLPGQSFYQSYLANIEPSSTNSRSDDEFLATSESPINVTPKTFSDIFINPRLVANSGGMVLVKKKVNNEDPSSASDNGPASNSLNWQKKAPTLVVGENKELSFKNVQGVQPNQESVLAKLMKANWSDGSKPTLVVGDDR